MSSPTGHVPPDLAAALAGRYRIERELGAGGMATVYLAHDLKHDRRVALKVLKPELAAVIGGARFLAEIRTTANLQHPHILPLHDSGEVNGTVFYVMPFVEGESLRDRLVRETQLPVEEAVRLTREVASALDYAHRHQVIHRDIKPENILLHEGQALVADFGIALAASAAGGTRMTETGMSLGTPTYMSPEQAMGDRALDARSDIYALGFVLYEMLSGEPPFSGPTAQAIVAKVLTERPVALRTLRDTVPAQVEAAVHKALGKLPADRWGSAAEFSRALADGSASGVVAALPSQGRRSVAVSRLALSLVAAGVLVVVGWSLRSVTGAGSGGATRTTRLSIVMPPGVMVSTGEVHTLAISRDGSRIAYATNRGLEIRALDSFTSRVVETTEAPWGPTFSPDGEWVIYLTSTGVWKVPVEGGSPIQVNTDWFYHATWGDDGSIYFNSAAGASGISVMSADGTSRRQLTTPDSSVGEAFHMSPELLPGGKLLYTATGPTGGWAQSRVMVIDPAAPGSPAVVVDGGSSARFVAPGQLSYIDGTGQVVLRDFDPRSAEVRGNPAVIDSVRTTHFGAVAHFAASREGTIAYIPGSERGKFVVAEKDQAGRVIRELFQGNPGWLSLSPDEQTLGISDWTGRDAQAWLIGLSTGSQSRVTLAATENEGTVWSDDGKRFLYSRQALGGRREVLVATVGSQADGQVLFSRPAHLHVHAWSPDGKWVVYNLFEGAKSNLYTVNLDATATSRLVAENSIVGDLSRDGRSLAYCVGEVDGPRVYVASFPDLERRSLVSSSDACWPRFSKSGQDLYFTGGFAEGDVGGVYQVRRESGDGHAWSAPRLLFQGLNGPLGVRENPTRFYKAELDSTRLAREVRVITGWNGGARR